MAAIIRIKRSTGTSAPGSLKTGELAYSAGTGTSANFGDRLFYGKGDDGSGNATSIVVIGGEYLANLLDHTPGTLTASSAIITDASSKIDNLKVDNIDIDGNTISSTDTNGNIVLDPNGSGVVDVNTSRITNVTDPTSNQDAATKKYVDDIAGAKFVTINGDTGTDSVNLSDSDITFTGGTNITSAVTNNTVTINLDGDVTGLTSLGVDNISINGNEISSSTGTIDLNPNTNLRINATGFSSTRIPYVSDNNGTLATSSAFTFTSGTSTLDVDGNISANRLDTDNIRIDGNTISSTDGSNTLYIDPAPVDSSGGDLIIRGNLTVQGTQTIINSNTLSVNDLNIVLADSAADGTEADGAGITVGGSSYTGTKPTITWDNSNTAWDFNYAVNVEDSIGGANSIFFNDVKITEAIEDHLVNNLLLAGEGIDLTYADASNTLTIAAELATVTNPGVANFDSDQMTVTSGLVSITEIDGGTF